MLVARRGFSRRSRTGSNFRHSRILSSARATTPTTWVLENPTSRFTFQASSFTGVRLAELFRKNTAYAYTNSSESLWQISIFRSFPEGSVKLLRPQAGNFISPSTVPTASGTTQSFTFRWNHILYEVNSTSHYCNVIYTVTLPDDQDYLEISAQIEAYGDSATGQTCAFSGFNILNLALDFGETPEHESFVCGQNRGHSVVNPQEHLAASRNLYEDRAYNSHNHRMLFSNNGENLEAGIVRSQASVRRAVANNPGLLAVPMVSFGDRNAKQGLLIAAIDEDGNSAKAFQWYSDTKKLHVRLWDRSDNEFDAYGVGGRADTELLQVGEYLQSALVNPPGKTLNEIGWKVRLHPFQAPTRWVDHYAAVLFRDYVVPDQEAAGWLPKSFYERTQLGQFSEAVANAPFYGTIFQHTSGTAERMLSGVKFFLDVYKQENNYAGDVAMPVHIENPDLSITPNLSGTYRNTTPWGYNNAYTGIDAFQNPEIFPVNAAYSGHLKTGFMEGVLCSTYVPLSFSFSPGSSWFNRYGHSMELGSRNELNHDLHVTTGTLQALHSQLYAEYAAAVAGGTRSVYSVRIPSAPYAPYYACVACQPTIDEYFNLGSGSAHDYLGMYRDVLGLGTFGCFAHTHSYTRPEDSQDILLRHPRAALSHFTNQKICDLSDKFYSGQAAGTPADVTGKYPGFHFSHISETEYQVDSLLRYNPFCVGTAHITANRPSNFLVLNTNNDALGGSLGGYFQAFPEWQEHVPVWDIVYRDRSSNLNHVGSNLSNLATAKDVYFAYSQITGTSSDGYYSVQARRATTGEAQESAVGYMTLDLLTNSRMSVGYGDPDCGYRISYLADMARQQESWFNDPTYAHIANFSRQWMRILHTNQDYLLHGRLYHPLDTAVTPTVFNLAIESFRDGPRYSLNDYRSGANTTGEAAIMHAVSKHRVQNKYLLTALNWTTGAHSFVAEFDPDSYGFDTSYQVFAVDTASGTAGNRTLLQSMYPYEPYQINSTLSGGAALLLEFAAQTGLTNTEITSSLVTDFASVRYGYDKTDLDSSFADLSYSYGSQVETEVTPPYVGFDAPATQSLLNDLPPWMSMRQDPESVGYQLTNTWGQMLERSVDMVNLQMANMFLETADYSQRNKIYHIAVPDIDLTRTSRNLLWNSTFSVPDAARTKLPSSWTDSNAPTEQAVFLDDVVSFLGCRSIRFTGDANLSQTIDLGGQIVDGVTLSAYVLLTEPGSVKLVVSVESVEGSSFTDEILHTTTNDSWQRIELPVSCKTTCQRIKVVLYGSPTTGSIHLAAPQLEYGSVATEFRRNLGDDLPHVNANLPFGQVHAGPNKVVVIHPVRDESDFSTLDIPTRAMPIAQPPKNLEPFGTQVSGRKVTAVGEIFTRKWIVREGQVLECSLETPDVYGRYDIRDLRRRSDLQYGTWVESALVSTPLACTVRNDLLFVACKETWRGRTSVVLKVCPAQTPPDRGGYLESLADIELQLPFEVVHSADEYANTIVNIGFSETDPRWLVVNTAAGRRHIFRLFYDYYFYSHPNRRMYFLENYLPGSVQLT